jgi:transcriptional regulator with XRE-family HTH domain
MTINEIIKTKRRAMGMTQKELSILVGKNRSTVAKYEAGSGLTLPVIKALSRVLNIPIEAFIE